CPPHGVGARRVHRGRTGRAPPQRRAGRTPTARPDHRRRRRGRHQKGTTMKIVIIGGTGLVGSKLVAKLLSQGHDAVPASPATGVDTLTGAGLDDVLAGATAVVD